ncbi:MAG: FAD-linked oxidase C-terminal domain-containing protein [Alphaproteobacteria bacterium]
MLNLPAPSADVLSRREQIAADLRAILGDDEQLITSANELKGYETDGLACYRTVPMLVALAETTEQVAAVLKYCNEHGVPVMARGAGTSLAGGALPQQDTVVLGLSKMNEILDVNTENKTAVVQAGVTNKNISVAVDDLGLFYAPDPSSQIACTIGGNVAMNSGGAHCLKYGVTTNHILGVKFVTLDGEIVDIGGEAFDLPAYDLLGLIVGAEGQLGVVTEVTVRLMEKPEAARPLLAGFASALDAGACVAAIMATGRTPVAIEFMDKPAILACEKFTGAGYPTEAEALLIIEVEGSEAEIEEELAFVEGMAKDHGAISLRVAEDIVSAENIWKGRKSAFGAVGQISPDYLCMDGTIPVTKLPEVLEQIYAIGDRYGFEIANIFHAGDGNMHPLIMYDSHVPGVLDRVEECGAEILKVCVDAGGCITGEHGVGIEKRDHMPLMFSEADLDQMKEVKRQFDPLWLLNGGKVFPLEETGVPAGQSHPTKEAA